MACTTGCCVAVPTVLYNRKIVLSITQANLALRPTGFVITEKKPKQATYMYGVVNQTTGLVKAVGTTTGTAAQAQTVANAALTTFLGANGYAAATQYTVFIVGAFNGRNFKKLIVGDAFSTLSKLWVTKATRCFRVNTESAGVITATVACV